MADVKPKNRYSAIIERIFASKFVEGARQMDFKRDEIENVAQELGIKLPKNLGDLIYTFRYRSKLPDAIKEKAPAGEMWIIRAVGKGLYRLVLTPDHRFDPNPNLTITKVPDATPGIIARYAFGDEQALLARLRYNRLVDIFTGVTCYSLQNHLRTAVPKMGQVEIDEIYVGLDKKGAHYIFPVQAKGGSDRLNVVQIEQDFAVCAHKFPGLICRPLGAQFMADGIIALFEFEESEKSVKISAEKHYKLVPSQEITAEDLENYQRRAAE